MGAPNGFGSKKSRKNDQNFPNFFFRKKEYKSSPETQFHQKRPHRTDCRLKIARHENSTVPENGTNSSVKIGPCGSILKRSSSPSASLFKFGTDFKQHEKNNHDELEQSEHSIQKEIF